MSSFQRNEHLFSQIPRVHIQRSTFDRSHNLKTCFDSGKLVPIFVDEVLPGDTFQLKLNTFGRLATPITPFMDNLYLDTFFFYVPTRLVWDNWKKFNGEQTNPDDSTDFIVPSFSVSDGVKVGSNADYMGLPVGVPLNNISLLPFRSLIMIWDEWFRDENLQESEGFSRLDQSYVTSSSDSSKYWITNPSGLFPRGKRHDYFTSCLPWPQKGPGVELSLGSTATLSGTAPVVFGEGSSWSSTDNSASFARTGFSGQACWSVSRPVSGGYTGETYPMQVSFDGSDAVANLSSATAATINSLRQAFQLQRLYERDARGGTRYTEILRSHFGVVSPDARLQRPEYLGGSSTRININPVEQTSSTNSTTPQGNLAAYGTVGGRLGSFTKSFTEHGYIIGLANVRADLTYQQGINRMWFRRTRFDFYWPALAHLGEQAVLNKEIYADGSENDENVFGYQERWAEYRYKPSMITGKMRSTAEDTLDVWHLAQKFTECPTLSDSFIRDNPPLSRVLAVTDEPQILLDCWFDLKCTRPMPVYSVPGLIDHF